MRENDIGYARFLSGKVQAVAHTLEMGKYNEYSAMLDIVCAGKDVEAVSYTHLTLPTKRT